MDGGLRNRTRFGAAEEVNPLDGAINIVDAMLVFACGLMLSLVIYWNVDLGQGQRLDVQRGQEMPQSPEIRRDLAESQSQGRFYQKLGTVYKDPATGQLFMLTTSQ